LLLLKHLIPCALALALAKAGKSMLAKMAIIAITTSNSIKVNPAALDARDRRCKSGLVLVVIINGILLGLVWTGEPL
jgi:hypothetical protein